MPCRSVGEKMSLPYVNFYTSDFLSGTGGMTAATKGVYITLLCLIYETEGPLPQRWDALARRCGCTLPAFKRAIETLVDEGKIEVLAEGLRSDKCEKHLMQRAERRGSASAAAKTRWQKRQQKQEQDDKTAMPAQCEPEPEPDKEKRDTKVSPKKTRGTRLPETWQLPKDWGEWAKLEGWAESTIRLEAENFRDYWISKNGKDAAKVTWKATWRIWMRNSKAPKVVNGDGYARHSKSAEKLRAFVSGAD